MKKIISYLLISSMFLIGCNFLDLVPENDIETIESIFEKKDLADKWLKSCYSFSVEPNSSFLDNPAFSGSDELVSGDFVRQRSSFPQGLHIADGLQQTHDPIGNIWKKDKHYAAINYSNIFLANIYRVNNMPQSEKDMWIAEIKALKASLYFDLVKRYGPIILVPENIPTTSPIQDMIRPRIHVDICFEEILKLLDEAIPYLLAHNIKDYNRRGYYGLESAYALKAKVLLFAASPLFNGNEFYDNFKGKNGEEYFNPTYNHEKWKRAALATEEAIKICEENGKYLRDDGVGTPELQRVISSLERSIQAVNFESTEGILFVKNPKETQAFRFTLPILKSTDPDYVASFMGCLSPTIKMVEMYYTENGLPIDQDDEWSYSDRYTMGKEADNKYLNTVPIGENVLNLHLRREPRFYAHIATDRTFWLRGPKAQGKNLLVKAYQGESFGTQIQSISNTYPQNLSGYWLKKTNISEYPNSQYENNATVVDNPLPTIRLAELYLMKAEAWNEYEGPLVDRAHVYEPLNIVRRRAGIPDVEVSWKEHSITPNMIDTRDGMRQIIHQEINIELAYEGHRFWNLRRWKIAHIELNKKHYGWYILGDNARTFYNNFEGPIVVWDKCKFKAPRDYFFPLRSEEVIISSAVQNLDW